MGEISPSRYLVQAGWGDIPHLDDDTKREIIDSTQSHMRDARVHGAPSLGAGAIYPVPLTEVLVRPFQLPAYWPRCYALDADWNNTAALPFAEISYFQDDAGRVSFQTFGADLPDADFEMLWPKRPRLLRGVVIDGGLLDDIAHLLGRKVGASQ